MSKFFAIAIYRCEVAGISTESLDVQVRQFSQMTESEIQSFLTNEPVQSYLNSENQIVTWHFVALVELAELENANQGQEVCGFIADSSQFTKWASNGL